MERGVLLGHGSTLWMFLLQFEACCFVVRGCPFGRQSRRCRTNAIFLNQAEGPTSRSLINRGHLLIGSTLWGGISPKGHALARLPSPEAGAGVLPRELVVTLPTACGRAENAKREDQNVCPRFDASGNCFSAWVGSNCQGGQLRRGEGLTEDCRPKVTAAFWDVLDSGAPAVYDFIERRSVA